MDAVSAAKLDFDRAWDEGRVAEAAEAVEADARIQSDRDARGWGCAQHSRGDVMSSGMC